MKGPPPEELPALSDTMLRHQLVPIDSDTHDIVGTGGNRIKCYVIVVSRGQRGTQVDLPRTRPNLVRKLFAFEVSEIADGSVEIAAVAR